MRKIPILVILCITALSGQTASLKFPRIDRLKDNRVDPATAWKIVSKIDPQMDGQSIYSLKYLPDGRSVIIGSTDFSIFRISLNDGRKIWKVDATMKFQKEFDGPEIFDVSPDGKFFISTGQTDPEKQSSERYMVIRSTETGAIVKKIKSERSTFHTVSASMDHRYSAAEEKERIETGLGFPWALTISSAKYVENGSRIIAAYRNNMEGPNLYDWRLMIYDAQTLKKVSDMQLTCDKQTANWDQPAGFEIGHSQFPYLYNPKKKSFVFGTAHGRIHEMDPTEMAQNIKTDLVEEKTAGKVLIIPHGTAPDMEEKDMMTMRFMASSPDGRTVFASGGPEGGYIQLFAYDFASKKEIFHSTLFDAGRMIAPSNDVLVIGGIFSSGKFVIADIRSGKLVFASQGETSVSANVFDTNPAFREVAALAGGNQIVLLRPADSEAGW